MKMKVLMIYLVNMGILPFITLGLFDLGIFYGDAAWALIILGEVIIGTALLISFSYKEETSKKLQQTSSLLIIDESGMVRQHENTITI